METPNLYQMCPDSKQYIFWLACLMKTSNKAFKMVLDAYLTARFSLYTFV